MKTKAEYLSEIDEKLAEINRLEQELEAVKRRQAQCEKGTKEFWDCVEERLNILEQMVEI